MQEIRLDLSSAVAVYQQIKQEIIYLIAAGTLSPGDMLDSVRELAARLRVNQNTVLKAYYQLEMEGYLSAHPGKGYFVASEGVVPQDVRDDIFSSLSEEYLAKIFRLGFSMSEVVEHLKKKAKSLRSNRGKK